MESQPTRPRSRRGIDGPAIVAVGCCLALALFLCSIAYKFIARRVQPVSIETTASAGDGTHPVTIDWAARYPYSEKSRAEMAAGDSGAGWVESTPLTAYTYVVRALESTVEAYATDDILLHDKMVELANAYDRALGWQISGVGEYNGLVTLGGGWLGTSFAKKDLSGPAADIASFDRFCKEQGVPMLYVQLPFKISESDVGVSGVVDFSNENASALLAALEASGVDALDLRAPLAARQSQRGESWHAAFYRTDHHWLPQTGLWAAGVVANRLDADFGLDLDASPLSEERFTAEVYEDFFLGSQGKKATLAVASPEDFELLYPKDGARLTVTVPSLSLEKTGGFEVIYKYATLQTDGAYHDNAYAAYCYADVPLKSFQNLDREAGPRLLVIQDSFGNAFTPFLALTAGRIDALDLRYFSGSVEAFLRAGTYDAVVVAYSTDQLGYESPAPLSSLCWHNFR